MQYVIDVILALLLVYFTVRGFKRGFFKTVLSAGRLVLAILLTVALGSRVSQWIDRQYVNPPVYEKVHTKLAAMAADAGAQSDEFFRQLGEQYGAYLDKDELNRQAESNASSLDQMVEQYSASISNTVSGAISTVVGYLLTFVAAFAVAVFFSAILNVIAGYFPVLYIHPLIDMAKLTINVVQTIGLCLIYWFLLIHVNVLFIRVDVNQCKSI